jgi:hypothetical protein
LGRLFGVDLGIVVVSVCGGCRVLGGLVSRYSKIFR